MEVFDEIEIIDSKDVIIKVLDVMSNIKYFNKEDKEIINKIIEKLDNVKYNELINVLQECIDNKYYKANTRNKLKKISTELSVNFIKELATDIMHNAKTEKNNALCNEYEYQQNIAKLNYEKLIQHNRYIECMMDKDIQLKNKEIELKNKDIEIKKLELKIMELSRFKN